MFCEVLVLLVAPNSTVWWRDEADLAAMVSTRPAMSSSSMKLWKRRSLGRGKEEIDSSIQCVSAVLAKQDDGCACVQIDVGRQSSGK